MYLYTVQAARKLGIQGAFQAYIADSNLGIQTLMVFAETKQDALTAAEAKLRSQPGYEGYTLQPDTLKEITVVQNGSVFFVPT